MDVEAFKAAAGVGGLYYFLSTYYFTATSYIWQKLGGMALTKEQMDDLNVPREGLWSIQRDKKPIQLHWFPICTQQRLRTLILMSGLIYLFVSKYGLDIAEPLVGLIQTGLFCGLLCMIFNIYILKKGMGEE